MAVLKLLIVDDQKTVVDGLLNLVDWKSIDIDLAFGANSAAEARRILTGHRIDVMLCDIEMPVENGLSLVGWMREQGMDTKCIFLTAHAEFAYAQKSVGLGAFDYVVQPAPYTQIKEAVARAVDSLRGAEQRHSLWTEPNASVGTEIRKEKELWGAECDLLESAERTLKKMREDGLSDQACAVEVYNSLVAAIQKKTGDADLFWQETLVDSESYDVYREASQSVESVMKLVRFCAKRLNDREPRQDRDVVEEVIRYINENLDQEIHRQDLADHVYLNPDYLNRLFKKQTGKTLKEFVIEHKMDEARKMLEVTRLPVSIIAAKVGYDNFSHFSYAYKKVTGCSPLESRNAYQRGAVRMGGQHEE